MDNRDLGTVEGKRPPGSFVVLGYTHDSLNINSITNHNASIKIESKFPQPMRVNEATYIFLEPLLKSLQIFHSLVLISWWISPSLEPSLNPRIIDSQPWWLEFSGFVNALLQHRASHYSILASLAFFRVTLFRSDCGVSV